MVTEQQATDTAAAMRPNALPLDPLTSEEIGAATSLLAAGQDSELLRFVSVSLREPEEGGSGGLQARRCHGASGIRCGDRPRGWGPSTRES